MSHSETPQFARISHQRFTEGIAVLAARLAADDWTPDYLIGVGRGGLVPGAYLSHASGHALLSVDLSTQEFGFSGALLERLAEKTRMGERLLIVDDINDSGSTITFLRESIAKAGGIRDHVRVAVFLHNARSTAVSDYVAETIDRTTDKRWFIFPWEAMAPQATIAADAKAVPERLA